MPYLHENINLIKITFLSNIYKYIYVLRLVFFTIDFITIYLSMDQKISHGSATIESFCIFYNFWFCSVSYINEKWNNYKSYTFKCIVFQKLFYIRSLLFIRTVVGCSKFKWNFHIVSLQNKFCLFTSDFIWKFSLFTEILFFKCKV